MGVFRSLAICVLAMTGASIAAPPSRVVKYVDLTNRQATTTSSRVADSACTNGPLTRACWSSGFSIATDFDAKMPPAGKTVTYDLEITNTTMEIGGFSRLVQVINKQYPGPILTANWGDTLVVNVKNSMPDNGTSIHWHGLRQLNSCQQDGANGVTECPIAPGQTKTYKMLCTQFGTSWYHSHFSAQYAEGTVGSIVINGPASSNYDFDLGPIPLTDWYHDTAFALNYRALRSTTGPPLANNALINGKMKAPNGGTGGSYEKWKVTKGKKYRMRFINTGVNEYFVVSIDGHNMTVMTSDFVPIKPFTATQITLAPGQRHDIVVNANQEVGNYWVRADTDTACGRNGNRGNVKAILSYDGAADAEPTTTGITPVMGCKDVVVTPYVSNQVPSDQFAAAIKDISMDFQIDTTASGPLVHWLVGGSVIDVDWSKPTLQYIIDQNNTYDDLMNVFELEGTKWSFWVIQTVQGDPVNLPHPIHLHGHDFYVLGSGPGVWDRSQNGLNFNNPPRRDTATLPAGGYLIVGFPQDNPGAWLMHCHIPWHVGQGLSLQFLERKSEILPAIGDMSSFNSGCESWRKYWNGPHPYEKDDSGL